MENLIKPYELSVWEDSYNSTSERFEETKIAVIGSDTMTGPFRASNIVLNKNINGSATLSFTMYFNYFNPETGEKEENPLFRYLSNERKIKLHYMNEWYTFIIKERVESSTNYSYTFTCKDLFITELSKNGYNIQFDVELQNNQGTPGQLISTILDGSDWEYDEDGSDFFAEKIKEPLFELSDATLTGAIFLKEDEHGNIVSASITSQDHIFTYYSIYNNCPSYFQCLVVEGNIVVDDDNIITNGVWGYIDNASCEKGEDSTFIVNSITFSVEAAPYKGERLSHQQKNVYDTEVGQYVNVYTKNNTEYYGYVKTTYDTSNVVSNFMLEGQNFTKAVGRSSVWSSANTENVNIQTYSSRTSSNTRTYLKVTRTEGTNNTPVINDSFYYNFDNIFKIIPNANSDKVFDTGVSIAVGTKLVAKMSAFSRVEATDVTQLSASGKKIEIVKQTRNNTTADWGNNVVLCTFDNFDANNYSIATTTGIIDVNDASDYKTKRIIFKVYASDMEYYIEDIEVFYYYQKGDTASDYIKLGEAIQGEVIDNYYYYTPGNASDAYVSRGADNSYTPVYWNYEAIRTISGSKSNRFNLIQDVCEKFECWAQFIIPVDETGKRTSESKKVRLLHYVGKENYAGFKYGINLSSIQRTLNSDQLVTKLIVDQNSCEYGTNGFCTIARAEDNPTKSNFILNFDYFVSQGLLDETQVRNDLYDLEEEDWKDEEGEYVVDVDELHTIPKGYLAAYEKLNRYFEDANQEMISIETQMYHADAEMDVAGKTITAADTSIESLKNELYAAYGYTYEEIVSGYHLLPGNVPYGTYKYYGTNLTFGDSNTSYWKDLSNCETATWESTTSPFEINCEGNLSNFFNSLSSIMGTNDEDTTFIGKVRIITDGESIGSPFEKINNVYVWNTQGWYGERVKSVGQSIEAIRSHITKMTIDGAETVTANDTTYYLKTPQGNYVQNTQIFNNKEQFDFALAMGLYVAIPDEAYWEQSSHPVQKILNEIAHLENQKKLANDTLNTKEKEYNGDEQSSIIGLKPRYDKINSVMSAINEKLKDLDQKFFAKYSRFIQEGTWQSEDYYDDNLYYYEACNVSNTSAYPDTNYDIKVIEISEIEGFEPYTFGIGDKTYVEDTEFFGWIWINGVKTPRKQDVIISALSYNLDSPSQNSITVTNYNTQFEDLFSRIAAATQNVEYKSGQYQRAANIIDENGTISTQVLQNTLDDGDLILSNSFADSIEWTKEGFTVTNVELPTEKIRITTNGIEFTGDGGQNWNSAITSAGVNADYLSNGTIKTSEINLFDGVYNTFRWDSEGISAYSYSSLVGLEGVNKNKFVRFDRFGLYGVNSESFAIPETLVENQINYIIEKAQFGLVWNNFFLKTGHGTEDGMVKISSDDDFQVLTKDTDGNWQERIKIGQIDADLYGMIVRNESGVSMVETTDEGKLSLGGGRLVLDSTEYVQIFDEVDNDDTLDCVAKIGTKISLGTDVTVSGDYGFAQGKNVTTSGNYAFSQGDYATASGECSFAQGNKSIASGDYAFAQGLNAKTTGDYSFAAGAYVFAQGDFSHAEGLGVSYLTDELGTHGIARGYKYIDNSESYSMNAVAKIYDETAHTKPEVRSLHMQSVYEWYPQAAGDHSRYSRAPEIDMRFGGAYGLFSHVEGNNSLSLGAFSHAENCSSLAYGARSHAEGCSTQAIGRVSHSEGKGTIAYGYCQHAAGFWNAVPSWVLDGTKDPDNYWDYDYLYILGNGYNPNNRSNAMAVDFNGNLYLSGNVYVACDSESKNGKLIGGLTKIGEVSGTTDTITLTQTLDNFDEIVIVCKWGTNTAGRYSYDSTTVFKPMIELLDSTITNNEFTFGGSSSTTSVYSGCRCYITNTQFKPGWAYSNGTNKTSTATWHVYGKGGGYIASAIGGEF